MSIFFTIKSVSQYKVGQLFIGNIIQKHVWITDKPLCFKIFNRTEC